MKQGYKSFNQAYRGFTVRLVLYPTRSSFEVYDANSDKLADKDTMELAVTYIDNRLTREEKKADKPRGKLKLAVFTSDNYREHKFTAGTLTGVHGGTGNVIISGKQASHGAFYPDTPRTRELFKALTALDEQTTKLDERLRKYGMDSRRTGYGRNVNDPQALEEAMVKEYNEKVALAGGDES